LEINAIISPHGILLKMDNIEMHLPVPRFDESLCYGCWACYNRCPVQAIYTKKLRGKGHYPGPTEELRKKIEG